VQNQQPERGPFGNDEAKQTQSVKQTRETDGTCAGHKAVNQRDANLNPNGLSLREGLNLALGHPFDPSDAVAEVLCESPRLREMATWFDFLTVCPRVKAHRPRLQQKPGATFESSLCWSDRHLADRVRTPPQIPHVQAICVNDDPFSSSTRVGAKLTIDADLPSGDVAV
jgi:hypothetical protein